MLKTRINLVKRFICIHSAVLMLFSSSISYAILLGPYGALGLGQTRIQIPGGNVFDASSFVNGQTTTQVGELNGKVMIGYNFYNFFALEVSFADYARSQYKAYVPNGPSAYLKWVMSALNIVGKGYLPLPFEKNSWYNMSPYGILGFCEAWSNTNYQNSGVPFAPYVTAEYQLGGTDTSSLRPIVGGGVSYDIPNTQVSLAVEFTRISGTGNVWTNARSIPSAEMLTLNIYYSFNKPF